MGLGPLIGAITLIGYPEVQPKNKFLEGHLQKRIKRPREKA